MSDLERELRTVAPAVVWPETPDLPEGIRTRLGETGRRRPRWLTRRVALAVVLLLVAALAATLAVPSTRSAFLHIFGVGSVEVRQVDELPVVPGELATQPLGDRVTLDQARRSVSFDLVEPTDELGPPDAVYLLRDPVELVTFVWLAEDGPRLLVGQLAARIEKYTAGKAGPAAEQLTVDGDPAVWVGGEHVLFLGDPNGEAVPVVTVLARNTLVVDRGGVTVRVEGDFDRTRAIAVVRQLR
jgi:hypothetical protein